MPERLTRLYWIRIQRALRRVARSHGTTDEIALGVAIGMLIGMTPTVGLQMVIAAFVATLVGANRLSAILPVWITNPLTIAPIYTFNYWIGLQLVGGPDTATFWKSFNEVIQASKEGGFFEGMWNALSTLAHLGMDIQLPLWTGCFVVGIALAVPSFFVSRRAVTQFRIRLKRRRAARHDRVTAILSRKDVEAVRAEAEAEPEGAPADKEDVRNAD